MSQPEFDRYAGQYDRHLSESIPPGMNEDSYFAEYKIARMANLLDNSKPQRILDFGCGEGRSLPYLDRYFPDAELYGYDVSPISLNHAAERTPRAKLVSDWKDLADQGFDAIIAANVFHHIPPGQRQEALENCRSMLAESGQMFIFEHNPYNPMTRWIFSQCPFDRDAEMLSMKSLAALSQQCGFRMVRRGYTLFFPRPLAFLRGLEPFLVHLPLGAQYYVQIEKDTRIAAQTGRID